MKTVEKERRLYARKGTVYLCYGGRVWSPSPGEKTSIDVKNGVHVQDMRPAELVVLVRCGEKTEKWVPKVELEGHRRERSNTAVGPPRSPGSEGYMVFLPPGSGGHKLGLPRVDAIEDAPSVACVAIEAFGVARELWEDCGWGSVVDRYDLQEVARVSYSGELSIASARQ